MNKILLLIILFSPLNLTASNSNARAPQSLGIGERPPSPAATHDREGKEQEPKAPVIYKDYSADLEEAVQAAAEELVSARSRITEHEPDDPPISKEQTYKTMQNDIERYLENYRQSIDNTRRFNARDSAFVDARDQKRLFAFCQQEQEIIYALAQCHRAMGQQYANVQTDEDIYPLDDKPMAGVTITLLNGQEWPATTIIDRLDKEAVVRNHGFTRLMCAAAQNNKEDVEALLANGADITLTTRLLDWMPDEQTNINLRACFAYINRDNTLSTIVRGYDTEAQLPENIALPAAIHLIRRQGLDVFRPKGTWNPMQNFDALSLSVIAGNHEIIDLLLQNIGQKLAEAKMDGASARELLERTVHLLIIYSDLAELAEAKPLFAALGIAEPKKEHYVAIARKLMRFPHWHWPSNYNSESRCLEYILLTGMQYGPTHIMQALAEERAQAQLPEYYNFHLNVSLNVNLTELLGTSLSGEKLGILFSLAAHEESPISKMRSLMLSDAVKYPVFLRRLQEYVREHQMLPTAMQILNSHLIPALSTIVRSYVTRPEHQAVPAAIAARILAISRGGDNLEYLAHLLVRNLDRQKDEETKKNTK